MAEAPVTPLKAKNPDVELLFQKMGEKLGWFQHKDLDSAMKSLTKSAKKRSTKSRVKHKSGDAGNKENNVEKGTSAECDKKIKKNKTKPRKQSCNDKDRNSVSSTSEESHPGYPLKPSKASTDLTRENQKKKKAPIVSESPLKEAENLDLKNSQLSSERSDHSDSLGDMPSMLEDIGAPLIESTRIHSRESISFYKLRDSFMSNGSNDSSVGLDQSSFDNLRICSGGDGIRYYQKDKNLIRIRDSLPATEHKKRELDTTDKYYSVVGESVVEEAEEDYYSVLEESPVGLESEKIVKITPLTTETENVSVLNCKSYKGTSSLESKSHAETQCDGHSNGDEDAADMNSIREKYSSGMSKTGGSVLPVQVGSKEKQIQSVLSPDEGGVNQIRTEYRNAPVHPSVVESDSSGSYYEVEDACAQTDNFGEPDEGSKPGSADEREEELGNGVETFIENKVFDLCSRLQGLTHGPEKSSDEGDVEAKSCEDADNHSCQNIENNDSCDSRKDLGHNTSPSDIDTSDGSFYEVLDQCVQTEADLSYAIASSSVTPETMHEDTRPRTLSSSLTGSTSGTPTLAMLQSATYEKLRMSLKKFKNTPTVTGSLMENVLKKVNLFGSHSSLRKSNKTEGDVSTTPEAVNRPTVLSSSLSCSAPGTPGVRKLCKDKDSLTRKHRREDSGLKHPEKTKDRNNQLTGETYVCRDKESELNGSGGRETRLVKDTKEHLNSVEIEKGEQKLCLAGKKIGDSEEQAVNDHADSHKTITNQSDRFQALLQGIMICCDEQSLSHRKSNQADANNCSDTAVTPLKCMSLETPSRRNKLSLKKSRPVKKSSASSVVSSTSENELYKTGFSSPDYGSESPPKTPKPKLGICLSKIRPDGDCSNTERGEPSITIPDSPPPVKGTGSDNQANADEQVSDSEVAGVPDSASDEDCKDYHSVCSPKGDQQLKNDKSKKLNPGKGLLESDLGEIIQSSSSSDETQEILSKKEKQYREKTQKKSVSSKRNVKDLDDSFSDQETFLDKDDRYCVTVADTSTWRSSKKLSESSEEEDLEAFFQKMKKPVKSKKLESSLDASDVESMKDFIVGDSDVESEDMSDEDVFYLKTDNRKKEPAPSIPKYITSSDDSEEESETEEESEEEEVYKKKKPREKLLKTSAPVTPLPRPVPRNYETPKTQITSSSAIPNSAKFSSSVKIYSFLKSLTAAVPDHRRHPDASLYVKQFKKYKGKLTQQLFKLYNQTVFDNKLPTSLDISWNNRMLKTAGYCKYMKHHMAKVELSDKVCDSAERVRDTLIHELCHAASWILNHKNDGHGPYWKYWTKKANLSHPELEVISRCHSYKIATKYTYQCVGCGYSIGRHSKSLDTDRKVCGKCHGRFQVRLTKDTPVSSTSSTHQMPHTPRTPNRFALFVKEKYGHYKKERRDLKHKDIMQLLSQEFAAKNRLSDS